MSGFRTMAHGRARRRAQCRMYRHGHIHDALRVLAWLCGVLLPIVLLTSTCSSRSRTLAVGTSADWEPFEFITEDGTYTGFDIELMEEIGKRLDLKIEWHDRAFDTLIDGLTNGELDAVIAAMHPTRERAARVDFTEPYYVSVDALLILDSTDVTLESPQDLAGRRTGVLSGSVQAAWVEENTGATTLPYNNVEQAIAALETQVVEVLVADYYTVRPHLDQPGITLAMKAGYSNDTVAIAVQKGDSKLREQLTEVIRELQAEGFIEELALKYLADD